MKVHVINMNRIRLSNGDSFDTELGVDVIEAVASLAGELGGRGRKVQAIKVVRSLFNIGLREAKCFVEDAAGPLHRWV